jgi:hypothetical protein
VGSPSALACHLIKYAAHNFHSQVRTPTVLDGPQLKNNPLLRPTLLSLRLWANSNFLNYSNFFYALKVCVSTLTPTPIVDDNATFRKNTPLLVAGFALFNASTKATKLPSNFVDSNERLPIVA